MTRFLLAIVFLAAACSPSAFTQGLPGTVAATPHSSLSAPTVTTTATPKPTPSVLALGEAYLVVADQYNHGRDRIWSDANSTWTLANLRYACAGLVVTTDEYVAGLSKIPFTTAAMKKDAAALVKEAKLESQAFRSCAKAKSMTTARRGIARVDALTPSGTVAAKQLRKDLGLSTNALP